MDPQELCAEYGEDFKMSPQRQVEDAIAPPSLLQVTVFALQGCHSFLEGVIRFLLPANLGSLFSPEG